MTIQDQISQFLNNLSPSAYRDDLIALNSSKSTKYYALEDMKEYVETQMKSAQLGVNQDNKQEKEFSFLGFQRIKETYFPDSKLFEEDPNQFAMF